MGEPDYKGFAIAILNGWPEPDGEGMDGFDLQELGAKHGLLRTEIRTEPCQPEGCACAEWDDFPQTCYRVNWK